MIYIRLVCVAGMSTSMLVQKMRMAAEKRHLEAEITAMPKDSFKGFDRPTDILLLGPQITYAYSKMKAEYEPKGIKVAVIESRYYGMMDGEMALNQALSLLEDNP